MEIIHAMNLGGLDLNLLVALDALLRERSVTRAAAAVGLSQPGMSNALARLRALFGDPLLVRRGAVLVPTPRAEALAGPVREALELIRGALEIRERFDPAAERRTFRLSCSDYTVLMLIGPLLRSLAAEAPAITIEVLPRLPEPGRALRDADVDFVIEPTEIMGPTDLPTVRLWQDRWMCCVWDGNTQVGEEMTLDAFSTLGHLIYSMGGGQPVALPDLALARLRVPRRIEFSVESFLLAPFLMQGTDLVALVPARAESFLRRTGEIRLLEPPVELPVFVEALWWHSRATPDPGHAWLRDRIEAVAQRL
jgi:LysR family nod box-dependent transcriptional activator